MLASGVAVEYRAFDDSAGVELFEASWPAAVAAARRGRDSRMLEAMLLQLAEREDDARECGAAARRLVAAGADLALAAAALDFGALRERGYAFAPGLGPHRDGREAAEAALLAAAGAAGRGAELLPRVSPARRAWALLPPTHGRAPRQHVWLRGLRACGWRASNDAEALRSAIAHMTTAVPASLDEARARRQAASNPEEFEEFENWLEHQPRTVRALWKHYLGVGFMTRLAATEEYCFALFLKQELRRSHRAQATRLLDRMLSFEAQEVEFWTRTMECVMPSNVARQVVAFALNPPLARSGEAAQTSP
jgi:hypothetical protein